MQLGGNAGSGQQTANRAGAAAQDTYNQGAQAGREAYDNTARNAQQAKRSVADNAQGVAAQAQGTAWHHLKCHCSVCSKVGEVFCTHMTVLCRLCWTWTPVHCTN